MTRYIPILIGILIFAACNNHKVNIPPDTDPVLQADPKLKGLTEAIKQSPGEARLYANRGAALYKMQFDQLAIKDYKSAIMLDSSKAEYYSAIGNILFEEKNLNDAVGWLQKAIARDPNDRKAHLKIAKLFLYIKDYPKAFSEINIVLRQDVYNPEAYFLKGMLYKDAKDTAKAISSFQTAIQVAPDYKDAMVQLGLMYSQKNDSIALRYLDNAFKLDTTDVTPLYAKGMYYQDRKEYEKAKEMYKQCIIRDRQYADAYFNMGYILMQQDSTQKAWRQYDIVTKIESGNATAFYNRGLCSELMDSFKNAVKDYKTALRIDTSYTNPKEGLKRLGAGK